MQIEGIWADRGDEENRRRIGNSGWDQVEWEHHHLLHRWDFEELLTELRCNPVLRGKDGSNPIIAKEYFAQA